jgi:hypothetical protein
MTLTTFVLGFLLAAVSGSIVQRPQAALNAAAVPYEAGVLYYIYKLEYQVSRVVSWPESSLSHRLQE